VRLSAGFIREGIEDAESRWRKADRKPGRCRWFFPYDRQTAAKKALKVSLLSGFCL
jgi:hypothetical protein